MATSGGRSRVPNPLVLPWSATALPENNHGRKKNVREKPSRTAAAIAEVRPTWNQRSADQGSRVPVAANSVMGAPG
jgi:hypothetical protein